MKILMLFDLKFPMKPWAGILGDYRIGPQILSTVFDQPVGWNFR
jgi:hypothetical protein